MDETGLAITLTLIGVFMFGVIGWATWRLIRQTREGRPLYGPRKANTPEAIAQLPVDEQVEKMRKSIRSWAWISLGMGVLSLVAGQVFNSPWGIVQILVGLASFYFYSDYPMFMVYTGVFAWAGLLNLSTFQMPWLVAGALQLSWAWTNLKLFNTYRSATQAQFATSGTLSINPDEPPPLWEPPVLKEDTRAQRVFPWLALFLGAGGAVGFLGVFLGLFTLRMTGVRQPSSAAGFVFELAALLAVMGVPVGIASLRAGYRPKPAAVIGLVFGAIMVVVYGALLVMARTRGA